MSGLRNVENVGSGPSASSSESQALATSPPGGQRPSRSTLKSADATQAQIMMLQQQMEGNALRSTQIQQIGARIKSQSRASV